MARDKDTLPFDFAALPKPTRPDAPPAPPEPPILSARDPQVTPATRGTQTAQDAQGTQGTQQARQDDEPVVLTVAELGGALRGALDRAFGARPVWVEGEVTGARPAQSGHVYFTLKDEEEDAAVDVVMYRSQVTPRTRALVKDGAKVRVRGKVTFWAPRGRVQMVADRLQLAGAGATLLALEELRARLAAEGLFAPERRRRLPGSPRRIGVVTSAQGAVIHDICKVAFRRGGARILLAAAQVQGAGAAESIVRALRMLARVDDVDVVILARGGGSVEDLMAFNDEAVVRAVADYPVPIVSAVGHEVDVTLVDFAADIRASTPSQAAELLVPDARERAVALAERNARLHRAMGAVLSARRLRQSHYSQALRDPRLVVAGAQQRLDELEQRLKLRHPRAVLNAARVTVAQLERRALDAGRRVVTSRAPRVRELMGRLDAMSPLKVLGRGYAIATLAGGRAVRDAAEVSPGDELTVRVARGVVVAEVKRREEGE